MILIAFPTFGIIDFALQRYASCLSVWSMLFNSSNDDRSFSLQHRTQALRDTCSRFHSNMSVWCSSSRITANISAHIFF